MNFSKSFENRVLTVFFVSVSIFLIVWQHYWPYTGDGDSMLHYFNLKTSWHSPADGLVAWARPFYVLIMFIPAHFGFDVAKIFSLAITIIATWQTKKLADDLQLRNTLLVTVFFIFQPLVFAYASDTMTEIPMALALVVFLRLWIHAKYTYAFLLLSILPYLRPEGFLIIVSWSAAALFIKGFMPGSFAEKVFKFMPLLLIGTLLVFLVSYFITDDFFYYIRYWSWAKDTYKEHGDFWHHFKRWPDYCGWLLFPFFMFGLFSKENGKILKLWLIFLVVFFTHTILYWKGSYGALGLMRIMVCIAPVTAIIMLNGFNLLFGKRIISNARFFSAFIILSLGSALVASFLYVDEETRHKFIPAREAAQFINKNYLLAETKSFFCSDMIVQNEVAFLQDSIVMRNSFSPDEEKKLLQNLPVGTLGVWDNVHGKYWYSVSLDELSTLGYETIQTFHHQFFTNYFNSDIMNIYHSYPIDQIYVVVKKIK